MGGNIFGRAARGAWRFLANSPRLRLALMALGGALGGLYLVAALVVLNLDADTVRDKITESARQQGLELAIGQLELSFPFAVTMNDVRLEERRGNTVIEAERLRASVAVWRFLILKPTFRFRAESGGGSLALSVEPSLFSAAITLKADAAGFPLDRVVQKTGGTPLPFAGKLDGGAKFVFHPMTPSALEGKADFRLSALSVKSGGQWGSFLAGFTPKEARCAVEAGGKRLATKECGIATSMGTMELRAGAALKDSLGGSALEGAVVFSPQGAISNALETLYGKRRKADGKYYFPVGGTLGAPALSL